MTTFPNMGCYTLTYVSECGRFGLYLADRFGKRGPAAGTPYYVYDSQNKGVSNGYNAMTKAHAAAWVAYQRDGSKYLPWFGSAAVKAPAVWWRAATLLEANH